MKFYVVRHSLTESNAAGITQGWDDSRLTTQGIEEAEKLGNFLKDKSISIIYTSDLGRCVQTSEIINKALKVRIIKEPQLREQNYGKLNNNRLSGKDFNVKNHSAIPEDGESFLQMKVRVLKYIKFQLPKGDAKILIVTHDGCFRALLSEALNIDIDSDRCNTTPLTIGLFELKNSNLELNKRFAL